MLNMKQGVLQILALLPKQTLSHFVNRSPILRSCMLNKSSFLCYLNCAYSCN
jgi:hypothetical protein